MTVPSGAVVHALLRDVDDGHLGIFERHPVNPKRDAKRWINDRGSAISDATVDYLWSRGLVRYDTPHRPTRLAVSDEGLSLIGRDRATCNP